MFRYVLILASLSAVPSISAQSLKIDGVIYSEKSLEPIPFAYAVLNDYAQNVCLGAISDDEGKFAINIPPVYRHDTLEVSFVGYHPVKVLLDTLRLTSGVKIYLEESTTYLKSIVIRDLSAKELVQKCVGAVKKNYFNTAFLNDCFYWQSIEEDNTYKNLAEGYFTMLEDLNEGMKRTLVEDSTIDVNPLVSYQYLENVENALNFDFIRLGSNFMNIENFDEWEFSYDDQGSLAENHVLVDAFRLDKMVSLKILLNDIDYSFERVDYSYKWNSGMAYNVNDSLFYQLGKVNGTVVYKKEFLKYNLNYIYSDVSYDLYRRYTNNKLFTRRIGNEISVFSFKELANKVNIHFGRPASSVERIAKMVVNTKEYCEAASALKKNQKSLFDN